MDLFKDWCVGAKQKDKKKTFQTYSEKAGGRDAVLKQLGKRLEPTTTNPTGSLTMSLDLGMTVPPKF